MSLKHLREGPDDEHTLHPRDIEKSFDGDPRRTVVRAECIDLNERRVVAIWCFKNGPGRDAATQLKTDMAQH